MARMNLEEVSIAILKEMQRANDLKKVEIILNTIVAASKTENVSVMEMMEKLEQI